MERGVTCEPFFNLPSDEGEGGRVPAVKLCVIPALADQLNLGVDPSSEDWGAGGEEKRRVVPELWSMPPNWHVKET